MAQNIPLQPYNRTMADPKANQALPLLALESLSSQRQHKDALPHGKCNPILKKIKWSLLK